LTIPRSKADIIDFVDNQLHLNWVNCSL